MKWVLLLIVVATTVASDLLQTHEMKAAARQDGAVSGIGRVLQLIATRWNLIAAVAFMAISFFAFLALVQSEPLSFAIPASSASFVIETILAKFILKERLTMRRAMGSLLVSGGIVLVAR